MTQHITQEVAIALAKQAELFSQFGLINGVVTKTVANVRVQELCNAAIQHYLDQHKADWPVLPRPYFGSGRYLGVAGSRGAYTTTQIQTYGAACAAHARELALMDAIKQVTILYEKDDYPVLTDICNLIATAK